MNETQPVTPEMVSVYNKGKGQFQHELDGVLWKVGPESNATVPKAVADVWCDSHVKTVILASAVKSDAAPVAALTAKITERDSKIAELEAQLKGMERLVDGMTNPPPETKPEAKQPKAK